MHVIVDSRKNNGSLFLLRHFAESSQVMNTCGVDERNLAHTDDTYFWAVSQLCHCFFKLGSDAEEIRAVDFVYLYTFGNHQVFFVYGNIRFFIRVNLIGNYRDFGSLHDTFHKEDASNHQSYLDSDSQVEDNGQEERDKQYGNVRFRILQ